MENVSILQQRHDSEILYTNSSNLSPAFSTNHSWYSVNGFSHIVYRVSCESGEEDLGARELLRRDYSAGHVSQTWFT
jgi:hypothetical protein